MLPGSQMFSARTLEAARGGGGGKGWTNLSSHRIFLQTPLIGIKRNASGLLTTPFKTILAQALYLAHLDVIKGRAFYHLCLLHIEGQYEKF